MKKQVLNSLKVVVLGLILSAGISYSANWAPPTGPAPTNNAQGPVNVGNVDQVKNSGLGLNKLAVFGNSKLLGNLEVGDYNVDPPSNGVVKVGSLVHNNPTDTHVCATTEGQLFLCGTTPPPPTGGFKSQIYSINGSGNQITSGDCSPPNGVCTDTTFITPVNYKAGSLSIQIIGAGGGGGGGFAFPYRWASIGCPAGPGGAVANDTGPAFSECQANIGGGGGGGGASLLFSSIPSQTSLQYNVTVGKGGNGGVRKGYGLNPLAYTNGSNWVNSTVPGSDKATNGSDGTDSLVIGPLPQTTVVAVAGGGKGGVGGANVLNPHDPIAPGGAGGAGGVGSTGNAISGQPGSLGKITIWKYVLDSLTGDLSGYGTTVHSSSNTGNGGVGGGANSAGNGGFGNVSCGNGSLSSGGGGGGAPTPFSATSGNGCKGGNGQVIFTWEEN